MSMSSLSRVATGGLNDTKSSNPSSSDDILGRVPDPIRAYPLHNVVRHVQGPGIPVLGKPRSPDCFALQKPRLRLLPPRLLWAFNIRAWRFKVDPIIKTARGLN